MTFLFDSFAYFVGFNQISYYDLIKWNIYAIKASTQLWFHTCCVITIIKLILVAILGCTKKIDGPRNETRLVPICIEQVRQQWPGRRLTTTSPATSAAGLGCAVEMPRSSPRTCRSIRALTWSTPMSALIRTSWFSNATTDGPTLITVISQNYTLHHFSGNFRLWLSIL